MILVFSSIEIKFIRISNRNSTVRVGYQDWLSAHYSTISRQMTLAVEYFTY